MREIIEGYVTHLNQKHGVRPDDKLYKQACDKIELAVSALPEPARRTAIHAMKNPD